MKKILKPLSLILSIFLGSICISAQDSLTLDLKSAARQQFSQKDYVKALPLYRELLNSFPGEPEYQLNTGICLVNLNTDMPTAIRILRQAASTDYSPLSWYYLGRALHIYYSFEDAIKAYTRFMLQGKSTDIKLFNVERMIEMARNGLEYTRTGYSFTVQNVQTQPIDQLEIAASINGSGKLMKKPIEFCSKTDIRRGYRPWTFLPSYTEMNEFVFVSGYEPGSKNGKQIFRIRNINHETWGVSEPLNDIINTPYDEEYPYFDIRSSTLYFSSTGHSSMGGYDIFRSVYDWNTKSWSRPENMGFPVNSTSDDFLYITDELNHTASFVSNRLSPPDKVNIYHIRLQQDTTGIHFVNVDQIRKASELQVEVAKREPVPLPSVLSSIKSDKKDSIPTSNEFAKKAFDRNDYNKVLSQALLLQIKADSAARITRDLRILARETPDDGTKKQLITDVLKNDKAAKSLQRQADLKFAEARQLKMDNTASVNSGDSVLIPTKEINGITVFQYKSETSANIPEEDEPSLPEEKAFATNNIKIELPKKDDFTVFEKPAYSDTFPIPQGTLVDSGLVYRIQMGVFGKARPNDAFGGISPLYYDQVPGTTVLKYYAGKFYTLNNVSKALDKIRSTGFPDAFIVAFFNGVLITTEKAKEIEFAGFKL